MLAPMHAPTDNDQMVSHLTKLLADEYILMNKSVSYLLGLNAAPGKALPEMVYDELKKNVKEITAFLRSIDQEAEISIKAFLCNSRLHNHSEGLETFTRLKNILSDHEFLISMLSISIANEPACDTKFKNILQTIMTRHSNIACELQVYLNLPGNQPQKAA